MLTKVLQTLIAKFITLKAAIRPQNIGHKATATKRPHFAHGCPRGSKGLAVGKFAIFAT